MSLSRAPDHTPRHRPSALPASASGTGAYANHNRSENDRRVGQQLKLSRFQETGQSVRVRSLPGRPAVSWRDRISDGLTDVQSIPAFRPASQYAPRLASQFGFPFGLPCCPASAAPWLANTAARSVLIYLCVPGARSGAARGVT